MHINVRRAHAAHPRGARGVRAFECRDSPGAELSEEGAEFEGEAVRGMGVRWRGWPHLGVFLNLGNLPLHPPLRHLPSSHLDREAELSLGLLSACRESMGQRRRTRGGLRANGVSSLASKRLLALSLPRSPHKSPFVRRNTN